MDLIILIIAIVYAIVKYADKNGGGNKKRNSTGAGPSKEEWEQRVRQLKKEAAASGKESAAGSRSVINSALGKSARSEECSAEAEQARRNAMERSHSERRWAEARRKQADALQVHAAGVDSCEGRLESLKVLYEAGILDREEYTQRVARVKRQHSH